MLSLNTADYGPLQASLQGENNTEKQRQWKVTKGAKSRAGDGLWGLSGHKGLHCVQQRSIYHTWAATGGRRIPGESNSFWTELIAVPLDCLAKEGLRFLGNFRAPTVQYS